MSDELHWLPLSSPLSGAAIWQTYDVKSRVDFTATAIVAKGELTLFDPIPLDPLAEEELLTHGTPSAIFLSSGNHERAASTFARRFGIPIHAHREAIPEFISPEAQSALAFEDGESLPGGFRVLSLPGGPEGESAFYHEAGGGTLILGDALINLGSTDFSILPDKYCLDAPRLRSSLRRLVGLSLQRLFFAHGLPLTQRVPQRLAALLETE